MTYITLQHQTYQLYIINENTKRLVTVRFQLRYNMSDCQRYYYAGVEYTNS